MRPPAGTRPRTRSRPTAPRSRHRFASPAAARPDPAPAGNNRGGRRGAGAVERVGPGAGGHPAPGRPAPRSVASAVAGGGVLAFSPRGGRARPRPHLSRRPHRVEEGEVTWPGFCGKLPRDRGVSVKVHDLRRKEATAWKREKFGVRCAALTDFGATGGPFRGSSGAEGYRFESCRTFFPKSKARSIPVPPLRPRLPPDRCASPQVASPTSTDPVSPGIARRGRSKKTVLTVGRIAFWHGVARLDSGRIPHVS